MFLKNLSKPNSTPYFIEEFLSIGTSADNHITLNDDHICEKHARIEKKNGAYIIRDLRSKYGTYVNGIRILEGFIEVGDVIKIGEFEFIFEKEDNDSLHIPTSNNFYWKTQLEQIPNIARTDLPVLLTGPSGSGKEVLAQYIHDCSLRRRRPIVKINCSALTESLAESELFGHTKGSFTGASHERKGAFQAARTGTLILDEIGDLPLNLQPKLLRALENKEIKPVGSDLVIQSNVRIIACTHQDLPQKVLDGTFRKDLFYRLNVVQIQLPSLLNRIEDFEKLLYSFAKEFRVNFSYSCIDELKKYPWPGNIRELKNFVSRASAYKSRKTIEAEDLKFLLDISTCGSLMGAGKNLLFARSPKQSIIKEYEKLMIQQRLIANRGNQKKTADDLGIPKSTLSDRIKRYQIDIDTILHTEYLQSNG